MKAILEQGISEIVKLTVLIVKQERVSVLYTGHIKEPEILLKKSQLQSCPDFFVSDHFPLYIYSLGLMMDSIKNEMPSVINISCLKNFFHNQA